MEDSRNSYLEEITAYIKDNSLFISAPKSSVTLFTPDTHQAKTYPRILIEDSRLPLVQCPKILGVHMDTSLTFNKHCTWFTQKINLSITTREPPKRMMKETLFARHRSAVEPLMIPKDRKTTLQAIHTMSVDQDVTSLGRNVVLDDRPPAINISEKELTQKERTTLAQLRSGHYRLLGSYKSRISRDVSLEVCADCSKTPHEVKQLFNCPSHPTTMTPSDLWNRPVDAIREISYLEAGVLD